LTGGFLFANIILMLTLKLKRIGKKHQASFRLVVDEKRHKLFGRNVEDLGWYDPRAKKHEFKKERITHWLKNGAQVTDTVHNLLVSAGIISGKKIAVHKQPKTKKGEAAAPVVPAAEAKPAA